ncbi:MAG: M15 family metallopeptidase [archaeon]
MDFPSDKELKKKISVMDNGEPLVRIADACPGLSVYWKNLMVREGVAKRLVKANSYLPKGYCLRVTDAYRSMKKQKELYEGFRRTMKKRHPKWSSKKLNEYCTVYVADPGLAPPHVTGGAVDVTVLGKNGRKLDMGPSNLSSASRTFSEKISKKARNNRMILVKAMKKAGFVNYPLEWWHWSYGDRLWAYCKKKNHAIYGNVIR